MAFVMEADTVEGDDAAAFLAAMLQAVQAECGQDRGVLAAEHTPNTPHSSRGLSSSSQRVSEAAGEDPAFAESKRSTDPARMASPQFFVSPAAELAERLGSPPAESAPTQPATTFDYIMRRVGARGGSTFSSATATPS